MNQIQVIGSHNSYHAGIAPSEALLMQRNAPKRYAELEYRHRPLQEQLDAGIQQIELDVYADSQAGAMPIRCGRSWWRRRDYRQIRRSIRRA